MKSIYKQLCEVLRPEEMDGWQSTLYCKVTPESREIVHSYQFRNGVTTFREQKSGRNELWYDIPFAYGPWYDARKKLWNEYKPELEEPDPEPEPQRREFFRTNKRVRQMEYNQFLFVLSDMNNGKVEVCAFLFHRTDGIVYRVIPEESDMETVRKVYAKLLENFKKRKEF